MTKVSSSATTLANSLFEADNNALPDLNTVLDVINSSKDFKITMLNPSISLQIKYEILDEIFKKELSEKVLNFI